MGIGLGASDWLMAQAQARFAWSLDASASAEEHAATLYDLVADGSGTDGLDAAEQHDMLAAVRQAVTGLPSRTRAMLGMYHDDGLTLRETGEVCRVTEARVSQFLGQTMLALRTSLLAYTSA